MWLTGGEGGSPSLTVLGKTYTGGRVVKWADYEKPTGEWNTVEVIAKGDRIEHWVNGKVNMVGNRALLRKLLLKFRESHADAPGRVKEALASGQRDAAIRQAHTLRAVAGNIGAGALQSACADLERRLREFPGTGVPKAELEAVEVQLARVVNSIAAIDAPQAGVGERPAPDVSVDATPVDPVRAARRREAVAPAAVAAVASTRPAPSG
jgi:HPt (histidine-containing phosphotransfer) domain-containing protein